MDQTRRIKDAEEVALIESIASLAQRGYQKLKGFIRPGVSEREIQIEYESEVLRAGAHSLPYDTIVGAGTNAAILHAIPTSKRIADGELVLIDAGADVFDYCVDITRVFPANGNFSPQQSEIYSLVKEAQRKAIEHCRIGNEWHQVHAAAARVIADGLRKLKILNGEVDGLLETGAISVFFPHGVGHLVGLRVRDTGQEENLQPKHYYGVRIRVDLKLEENHLVTAEPGCYFIEALLSDSETRAKYKDQVNWTEAERWKSFGGVRIEDDVLITKTEPRVLTAIVEK